MTPAKARQELLDEFVPAGMHHAYPTLETAVRAAIYHHLEHHDQDRRRAREAAMVHRKLLVELAAAAESIVMSEGNARFRSALDAAWAFVDHDHKIRDEERMRAGCGNCGAPIAQPSDDLCAACAEQIPEVGAT